MKYRLRLFLLLILLLLNFSVLSAQTDSLQIVYLANTNAAYENCHCGENPLGGMDHIVYLVKEIRKKNPKVMVIDGGDFTNSYPFDELNQLTIDIYRHLEPDLVVTADQELQMGNQNLVRSISRTPLFLLGSNFTVKNLPLNTIKYLSAGKVKIALLAFLDQSSFWYVKAQPALKFDDQMFKSIFEKARSTSDFQIVIFHGERSELPGFLQKFPGIDLVLLAHDQSLADQLEAKPPVICAGSDGEYLSIFSIHFISGNFERIRLKKIPVSLEIPVDNSIEKLISTFKEK